MMKDRRSIFRSEAVEHYVRVKEEAVFPRFVSPRTAIYGWLVFALLAGAFVAVSFLSPLIHLIGGK